MIRDYLQDRIEALSGKGLPIGIGGFIAFSKENETRTYKAQVATQFLEDGSYASDHIINEPFTIEIRGVVGENNIRLAELPEWLTKSSRIAGRVSPFLGKKSQAQLSKMKSIGLSALDTIDKLDSIISIGTDLAKLIGGNSTKSVPEQFLNFIESVYYTKQLISVEVDFQTLENMAIESLSITRDNQSKESKFEMTLKKIQFTKTKVDDLSKYFQKPKAGSGVGGVDDKGSQDTKNTSLLGAILGR